MYQRKTEHDQYRERPHDLERLGDMKEYNIAEGEPDVRGWSLSGRDDNRIGDIDDLLVDTATDRVVFAVVNHGGTLGIGEKSTLIPLDHVRFDRSRHRAMFVGTQDDIESAPEYKKNTRDYNRFYDFWSGVGTEPGARATRERGRKHEEIEEHEEKRYRPTAKRTEVSREAEQELARKSKVRLYRRDIKPGREIKPGEQILDEGETLEIPEHEEHLNVTRGNKIVGQIVILSEVYEGEEAEYEEEEEKPRATRKR